MNLLFKYRKASQAQLDAYVETCLPEGERDIAVMFVRIGEEPLAMPAIRITIFEVRRGTFFHATTPFLCRGRIINSVADWIEAELERRVEPEEIGAVREPLPPRCDPPIGPPPKRGTA